MMIKGRGEVRVKLKKIRQDGSSIASITDQDFARNAIPTTPARFIGRF